MRRELFIFDASLTNRLTLISALPADAEIYLLDTEKDGIVQIAQILQGLTDIDALHIFSHGGAGSLLFGSTTLSLENINSYAVTLSQIGSSLSVAGDILLYGCNVGAGDEGRAFVDALATLTGADVAASDDLTGSAALGGDWVLEVESGVVESIPVNVKLFNSVFIDNSVTGASPDITGPTLLSLSIPTTVNLTEGKAAFTLSATAEDIGSGVDKVVIWLDKSITTTHSLASDSGGSYAFLGLYGIYDSWIDGVSSEIKGILETNQNGVYNIERVTLNDNQGNVSTYTSAQLSAMGINTSFSVTGAFTNTSFPTLTSSTPSDNATSVAVASNITLTFDENVQAGTGDIVITNGTDERTISVTDSAQITFNSNTVTINPNNDLQAGASYHVEIANGAITDEAGNSFAGISNDATLNFATINNEAEHHNLAGNITFWKTGEALNDVTLHALPTANTGTEHLIEFRNIELHADGSRTVEIWKTSSQTNGESLEFEIELQDGSTAQWQTMLPTGWNSDIGQDSLSIFAFAAFGNNQPLSSGEMQLGLLTLSEPTNPTLFTLSLAEGMVGTETAQPFTLSSTQTMSNGSGDYSFTDLQESNYIIRAEKANNMLDHAITAQDALAALKMAVGNNPNTDGSNVQPYQYLAADVNHDGRVRATDALTILKMAVGLNTAPESEWIFVAEEEALSATMSRKVVDWSLAEIDVSLDTDTELNLIGIVKGDVDGSWLG